MLAENNHKKETMGWIAYRQTIQGNSYHMTPRWKVIWLMISYLFFTF